MIINISYFVLKIVFLNGLELFNSFGYAMLYSSLVCMVFFYFHQVFQHVTEERILFNFNIWLCAGYLLNFLGSFFVILTYNYLTSKIYQNNLSDSDKIRARYSLTMLWAIPNILLLLSALINIYGILWVTYRKNYR